MSIELSITAADRVKRFLVGHSVLSGLRFGVRKSGCTGFAYAIGVDEAPTHSDVVYESNGVRIFVDKSSLSYVDGTRIDFICDGLNETFQYNNPNVKNACGCGESFGV